LGVEMRDQPPGQADGDPSAASSGATAVGKYAGIGLQFAASIVLFLYAGSWLDGRLGTEPLFVIVGVFLGATAGFFSIYKRLMSDLKRDEAARRKSAKDV
jgi:ATP synthase protein I